MTVCKLELVMIRYNGVQSIKNTYPDSPVYICVSFQRAEVAEREAEVLREQLSSTNQSQQLSSPTKADPDSVTHFHCFSDWLVKSC